jgi:hypothetical protein
VAWPALAAPELARLQRKLQRELDAARAIDFFPGEAGIEAEAAWTDFGKRIASLLSPDEPHDTDGAIPRLDASQLPGAHLGHAAPSVGRPRGQRLADPPLHRPGGPLPVAGPAIGLPKARSASTSTAPRSRTSAIASPSRP